MWGALLAASMAGWLHQLTAATRGQDILAGHCVRGGKAMIATLRRRLIAVPARLVRSAGQLILRLPPGHGLLAEVLARLRALPSRPDPPGPQGPDRTPETAHRRTRATAMPGPRKSRPATPSEDQHHEPRSAPRTIRGFGSERRPCRDPHGIL